MTPAVHFLEPRLRIQSAARLQSVCLPSASVRRTNKFKLALVAPLPAALLRPRKTTPKFFDRYYLWRGESESEEREAKKKKAGAGGVGRG